MVYAITRGIPTTNVVDGNHRPDGPEQCGSAGQNHDSDLLTQGGPTQAEGPGGEAKVHPAAVKKSRVFAPADSPAIRSRIEIGAISGQARPARRTMKVCSSMYWPLRQAWLVRSVKTIQVEPAGNSQRSLRQLSLKIRVFLHGVMNLQHEGGHTADGRSPAGPSVRRPSRPSGLPGVEQRPGSGQADPIRELARQSLEMVGGEPDPGRSGWIFMKIRKTDRRARAGSGTSRNAADHCVNARKPCGLDSSIGRKLA